MRTIAAALALLIFTLGLTSVAGAQAVIVKPGDVAKQDGIFIPAKDAVEAAALLDKFAALEKQIVTMQQSLDDKVAMILNLEKQLGSSDREIALKDLIIKNKDEMLQFRKEMNDEYKALLVEVRASMTKDADTIKRLEDKVEAANKRGFWGTMLGIILGVFTGGIGTILLH